MSLTIFGKPNCPECVTLKTKLTNAGENFEYVDITQNPEMREQLLQQGFRSVPQAQKNGEWIQVNEIL